jgi:hypothetical protein
MNNERDMSATAWDVQPGDRIVQARYVREGDRLIFAPTWPAGRLVVDVDHGYPLPHVVTFTYESDEACRETFGAADHVVIRRPI